MPNAQSEAKAGFDIQAKSSHPMTSQEVTAAMRTLLGERFSLQIRQEPRDTMFMR